MTAFSTSTIAPATPATDLIDGFVQMILVASAHKEKSVEIRERAYFGLAGHVCGSRDIQAIIQVAERLPKKEQKSFLDTLSVLVGWYECSSIDPKKGTLNIIRKETPLFLIKKDKISITDPTFQHSNPKIRHIAYEDLCAKRIKRRPLKSIKIADKKEQPTAKDHISALVKLFDKIEAAKPDWIGTESENTLDSIIQTLADKYTQFVRK